jgi:multiple antibiotic resistance protein
MEDSTVHLGTIVVSLLAIMNPVANAPIFMGLTEGVDAATRQRIALRAVVLAFAIVAVFALLGREIFAAFGITLPAFRIAGGMLVGLVGYHLLQGQESSVHTPSAEDNERSQDSALDVAVTPLALPVLAGPGTIATAMNFTAGSTLPELLRFCGALAIVCLLTWAAFRGSDRLVRTLGQNAIKVISRLMGLILAVVGVQMLIEGVRGAVAASP